MARKAIAPEELLEKSKKELHDAIKGQSALADALVTTAFIENALITLLSGFFIKGGTATNLLKPGNALGDLSKCADMAYCLGFLNEDMLKLIKAIGDIRNIFAHSHEKIDFDHPDLKKPIASLQYPQQMPLPTRTRLEKTWQTSRAKFNAVAELVFHRIMLSAFSVKRQKEYPNDKW